MEETIIQSIKNNTFDVTEENNLTEGIIAALIESDNEEYFNYLLYTLSIDEIIEGFNSVLGNIANNWWDSGENSFPDILIPKMDCLIENYQLSGYSFAKMIVLLLKFKNVDNLIKKIIDFQKFPTEYIISESSFRDNFTEKLCNTTFNTFRYILENTDVLANIKDDMIKCICRFTIIDRMDFLLDNNMINPGEIDLAYLFDDRSYDIYRVNNIINFLEYLKSKEIIISTKIFHIENRLEYLFKLVDIVDQKIE